MEIKRKHALWKDLKNDMQFNLRLFVNCFYCKVVEVVDDTLRYMLACLS